MLTNPFTGQTLERQSEDDEVLVMETTYAAGGAPAPAHFHPAQDEHFVVISGAVRTVVDFLYSRLKARITDLRLPG